MSKSRRDDTNTTKSTQKSSSYKTASNVEMDHILATIYYLDWAKNILEAYAKSINRLFVVPLTEHCVRKKVANATISDECEQSNKAVFTGRKLEEGVKLDNTNDELGSGIIYRVSLVSKKDVDNRSEGYVPVLKDRWISLAENSAMYRLTTLNQMSGSLLVFMERVKTWIEKHRKVFSQYKRECTDVLGYAVRCFESICVQADIFSLEPIDRSKVRTDCSRFISKTDPYVGNQHRKRELPLQIDSDDQDITADVKRLEAQINYYRKSVYLIGSSLTDITQAILKAIPREILEVTTKEVWTIMERLPPTYHFPSSNFSLSAAVLSVSCKCFLATLESISMPMLFSN
ncbi:hypothetical protein M3Y97_00601000 [Aphelenchoides bicaudatus]|nr:hypothetical protein M3Y97_00601000 [Aphelenchoides bicaudatus]